MSREQNFSAIILKKQPYHEGDEIITFFTKQLGKIRALAKSVKMPKSKLQQKLQALFLVDVRLTAGKMPKVIGAEPIKVYASLREDLEAMKMAFYAVELALKFTADEQKNEPLFSLLADFFEFLNSNQAQEILNLGLAKFKIGILETAGLGIHGAGNLDPGQGVFFSLDKGGFVSGRDAETLPLGSGTLDWFVKLGKINFADLKTSGSDLSINELQNLLSRFIEYQLERKIKSEKYLNQ